MDLKCGSECDEWMSYAQATSAAPRAKYDRTIRSTKHGGEVTADVYDVLLAFDVTNPATQHAAKKLLCAGLRGKGDTLQDLREAIQAIERAIQIEEVKA